jgi:hypothetical protein
MLDLAPQTVCGTNLRARGFRPVSDKRIFFWSVESGYVQVPIARSIVEEIKL